MFTLFQFVSLNISIFWYTSFTIRREIKTQILLTYNTAAIFVFLPISKNFWLNPQYSNILMLISGFYLKHAVWKYLQLFIFHIELLWEWTNMRDIGDILIQTTVIIWTHIWPRYWFSWPVYVCISPARLITPSPSPLIKDAWKQASNYD